MKKLSEKQCRSQERLARGLAWCSKCRLEKPIDQFTTCPGRRPIGLSSHCHECDRERKRLHNRRARAKNSKLYDLRGRLRKFGLTPEKYDVILEDQNGVCAICGEPEQDIHHATGKVQRLAVDHDHETGIVRGLLCARCNKGIGSLRHNPRILRAAITYLTKPRVIERRRA